MDIKTFINTTTLGKTESKMILLGITYWQISMDSAMVANPCMCFVCTNGVLLRDFNLNLPESVSKHCSSL